MGCKVIITTRFANDSNDRFNDFFSHYNKKHPKNKIDKNNLKIFSANFKDYKSVENFIYFIKNSYKKIHILINNAAQTVRKLKFFFFFFYN
jgi:NADP-dependent 3-hydroxy acid dehydrogenase YdfG